jgi:serralysin
MSGSNSVLKNAETTFQQDLNGDGLIGIPNVVIESFGSTCLTRVGSNYYLYNAGAGPQLSYGGTAVVTGQIQGWAPIAAEQISGGYQVVWKSSTADLYTLWTTDSSGNFVSFISAMSGSNSVLKNAEMTFQQDVNGDGVIGIPAVTIESFGSTSLTKVGSYYYLYNAGVGPQLKYGGDPVVAGQIEGWAPIAGEQISGGYQVVWKANGTDLYTLWTTDSSGNFVSFIPAMSASSSVLQSAENTFHQDLNADGYTGIHSSPLPATGLSGPSSILASPTDVFAAVGNDAFVFGSHLKPGAIAIDPSAAAPDVLSAVGAELTELFQQAQSQQEWPHSASLIDAHLADGIPTEAELASLTAKGFIFHWSL